MRLFIAIPIPEEVKREARRWQEELRLVAPDKGIRWATPEQFHLTLKFLGEVDPARVEALTAATRAACQGVGPFNLRAGGAGFFPNERNPRVLWAGLQCESGALQSLQTAMEAGVGEFAEKPEDRRFSPHLTLARIKQIPAPQTRALAAKVSGLSSRPLGEWRADCVRLMQSELHPTGSRHACVAEFVLA
jgi:RNA 2',3'-cyclic 3'-phosphodiesterase